MGTVAMIDPTTCPLTHAAHLIYGSAAARRQGVLQLTSHVPPLMSGGPSGLHIDDNGEEGAFKIVGEEGGTM